MLRKMNKCFVLILIVCIICTIIPISAMAYSQPSSGWYRIRNIGTGKFLNVVYNSDENGNNINIYHEDGTSGERYYLYYPGSIKGQDGTYRSDNYAIALKPECSNGNPNGRVVNGSATYSVVNGTNVILWNRTDHVTQTWYFDYVGDGYIIRNISNTNCVLTAAGNYDLANVYVANYDASNSLQKWSLDSVGTQAVECTSVTLSASTLSLNRGESKTLQATVYPTNATNKTVSWSSSNPSVASVNSNGTVTGNSNGTATITVRTESGNCTATCSVTVKESASISLSRTTLELKKGNTYTLSATVTGGSGALSWSSSNTKVATVNSSGKVTAKGAGTASITVTKTGVGSATCQVTVIDPTIVSRIVLSVSEFSMEIGDTYTIKATVYPSTAKNKTVYWKSNNTAVATVSNKGLVTAKSSGRAMITAYTSNGVYCPAIVTVNQLQNIEFSTGIYRLINSADQNLYARTSIVPGLTWKLEVFKTDLINLYTYDVYITGDGSYNRIEMKPTKVQEGSTINSNYGDWIITRSSMTTNGFVIRCRTNPLLVISVDKAVKGNALRLRPYKPGEKKQVWFLVKR